MRRGWVLVTDGGSGQGRSALAAVRALAEAGYPTGVTVSGRYSLAAASRYCQRRIDVPPVTDASGYKQAILAEVKRRRYLTVMPTSDSALLVLGRPVKELVDKVRLSEKAGRVGLAVPETARFDSTDDLFAAAEGFDYPVVMKPAVSRWPAACLESRAELTSLASALEGPFLIQPFLRANLRAVCGVMWKGRLVAASHQRYFRTWPRSCGTASAAETTTPDMDLEKRVVALLAGYEGIFQAQLAAGKLLDLNARPYGSMPLAVEAGANLASIYCDLLHGVEYPSVVRARPGVFYRWVEGDLRNLLSAYRRGELGALAALKAMKPRRRAAHSTESLADPKPALARIAYALRRAA